MTPLREIEPTVTGILLLGDFRGVDAGAPPDEAPLRARPLHAIDRDDLDAVLARLAPAVHLPGDEVGPPVGIDLRELEDFDPDRLVERVPLLQTLREERARPSPPAPPGAADPAGPPPDPARFTAEAGGSLLDQIVDDAAPSNGVGLPRDEGALAEFIRRAVEPHRVPPEDPRIEEARRAIDRELHRQLRRILHHPRFQAVEAHWRGLDLLVRRLETGPGLKLFIVQATPAELQALGADGFAELLETSARTALEGEPWSLALPLHGVSAGEKGLAFARAMVEASARTGVPFAAEVQSSFLDLLDLPADDPFARGWKALRTEEGARGLTLLLPRLLLRLPWSRNENPCETIELDEFPEGADVDRARLLWGHPGFAAALLAGSAGRGSRIEGLPIGIHAGAEGAEALPHTEIELDTESARALAALGLAPVLSRPGEGWVAVAPFRPIAAA